MMESIIDPQSFSNQQLMEDSSDFLTSRQDHPSQQDCNGGNGEDRRDCDTGSDSGEEVSAREIRLVKHGNIIATDGLRSGMQTLIATTANDCQIHDNEEARSVVMVIDYGRPYDQYPDDFVNDPQGSDDDEDDTYQTLTSVNDRISPADFSPTSYATLTPIQPLPPISTMSDKFAYTGHISGTANTSEGTSRGSVSTTSRINDCGNRVVSDGRSNGCGSFSGLPLSIGGESHNQEPLGNLSLSGLGGVQSPYSSFDKLPSLISSPPNNFSSSPSHGISVGIVGSCDLHTHSSSVSSPVPVAVTTGCGPISPQSQSEMHSPQLQANVNVNINLNEHKANQGHGHGQGHHEQLVPVSVHKQVICLSPPTNVITDAVGVSDYDLRLQHSPVLRSPSVSAGSVVSMSLHSPVASLPHMSNGTVGNLAVDLPVVVALNTSQPLSNNNVAQRQQILQTSLKSHQDGNQSNNIQSNNNLNVCNINQQELQAQMHQHHHSHNEFIGDPNQEQKIPIKVTIDNVGSNVSNTRTSGGPSDMEEINTKELAQRISAELKRYSIPQAIFAQRVLCRSQGTLSDLLRNPKPWSKLKSGRETFRRMFKWLQEPEFQRMSALRMAAAQIPQRPSNGPVSGAAIITGGSSGTIASPDSGTTAGNDAGQLSSVGSTTFSAARASTATLSVTAGDHGSNSAGNVVLGSSNSGLNCRRKDEPHIEQMPQPKKPRLVFTDLQRRTLQAIFKETKRPSKEMQVTIARQLGLEPTTVGNFFMNARRRSMDKWRDDDTKIIHHPNSCQNQQQEQEHDHDNDQEEMEIERDRDSQSEGTNAAHGQYSSPERQTSGISPLGHFDDDGEMDLELEHHDFLMDDNERDDML
ncbi:onecut [Drosophila busckii]|uniref:One cut domain family member n=1 Tax=Drosophila busckii TaxID=30019 RepID=A0A0M4EQD0_DROBS|nr:onecut [Drosophila busckii]